MKERSTLRPEMHGREDRPLFLLDVVSPPDSVDRVLGWICRARERVTQADGEKGEEEEEIRLSEVSARTSRSSDA